MNQEANKFSNSLEVNLASQASDRLQVEETLRMLARLEPPVGIAERVHYRLQQAQVTKSSHRLWPMWMSMGRMQYAAAAALALVIGASSWGVYHSHHDLTHGSAPPPANQIAPSTPGDGFGTAGAERHPGSLTPIKVPPAHKKKPSASRLKTRFASKASEHASGSATSQAAGGTSVDEPRR